MLHQPAYLLAAQRPNTRKERRISEVRLSMQILVNSRVSPNKVDVSISRYDAEDHFPKMWWNGFHLSCEIEMTVWEFFYFVSLIFLHSLTIGRSCFTRPPLPWAERVPVAHLRTILNIVNCNRRMVVCKKRAREWACVREWEAELYSHSACVYLYVSCELTSSTWCVYLSVFHSHLFLSLLLSFTLVYTLSRSHLL